MKVSSPRTWGCFLIEWAKTLVRIVFPTHVGVFLLLFAVSFAPQCLPHARGGVSGGPYGAERRVTSSPRTWGCFPGGGKRCSRVPVFPTHVGVFLIAAGYVQKKACLPHARGGVSVVQITPQISRQSSPRTWGCFCQHRQKPPRLRVFPTHVGVFPLLSTGYSLPRCLPHARGGVS
ncbi:Domain of uncharacterised function (DUF2825) [Klebsiella pneumoniae]|nr:Domain of uncharacterised function (DUF2825) [Klebsiella pneumoniae]